MKFMKKIDKLAKKENVGIALQFAGDGTLNIFIRDDTTGHGDFILVDSGIPKDTLMIAIINTIKRVKKG